MSKRLSLSLVVHNHQPVGNFAWVFERIYTQAYEPFISVLERHPRARVALHYSGALLDWLQTARPSLIGRVAALVRRGQVEILTGAYYAPILAVIPDADKVGQIRRMSDRLQGLFGERPTGMWLAERVWEPHLPRFLAAAGVDYVILDDAHFLAAGLRDQDLGGYYVTEEEGQAVRIVASLSGLSERVVWRPPEEVIEVLRGRQGEGPRLALVAQDGEKFGAWPGTHQRCYEQGWLDQYFQSLVAHDDWLTMRLPGDYVHSVGPLGRVYLPTASYAEMNEWSLPIERVVEHSRLKEELAAAGRKDALPLRGGFWRNFLVKYPEINWLQKKMLRVHRKVHSLPGRHERAAAMDELWQGQGGDAYWHGVFGGVYLNHIRAAAYGHLLRAEQLADAVLSPAGGLRWELTDFDCDGYQELLVETGRQNLYFHLGQGGGLMEWDYRPAFHNLSPVLSRRAERYHQTVLQHAELRQQEGGLAGDPLESQPATENGRLSGLAAHSKEEGLVSRLAYDWYGRANLIDHFLAPGVRYDEFARSSYGEQGDFVNQPYSAEVQDGADSFTLALRRDGHVWQGLDFLPARVEKLVRVEPTGLEVEYRLENIGTSGLDLVFGCEWNVNLVGGSAGDIYYRFTPLQGTEQPILGLEQIGGLERLEIGNRRLGLNIAFGLTRPSSLWHFSVESITNSSSGFERVQQGQCLLFHWCIRLEPGEQWQVGLSATVTG